jgi:hypothetical protein
MRSYRQVTMRRWNPTPGGTTLNLHGGLGNARSVCPFVADGVISLLVDRRGGARCPSQIDMWVTRLAGQLVARACQRGWVLLHFYLPH